MGGLVKSVFGSGKSTSNVNIPPPTPEELELIKLTTELTRKQLQNIDQLAPFQRELIELSLADLRRQADESRAFDAAISPQDQAAFAKDEFERAKRLGPVQDQILEMQLANMRGELTPGQQTAVDAAIKAGFGDIDIATEEGIGLISDEIANARGLRLTDTPILREATMLADSALKQKASLAKNIRSQALFQMPGQAAGIGLAQQQLADQTKAFQAELRNRAFQNRLTLTGQTANAGIGLATVGSGSGTGTLSSLTGARTAQTRTTGFDPARLMTAFFGSGGIGGAASGVGAMMKSDRRLKRDIVRIGALESGLPVYRFKFLDDDVEHIGVMADEVMRVMPLAVSSGADGYFMVDYAMLR